MADLAKLAAGTLYGLTFTNCGFTLTDFNSRANNGFVLGTTTQTNATSLDLEAIVSFEFKVGGTSIAGACVLIFLMPLNRDGSTFGDATATGSALPNGYLWDVVPVPVGITSGNLVRGTSRARRLPFRDFRWGIGNGTGVALHSTADAQVQAISGVLNLNA